MIIKYKSGSQEKYIEIEDKKGGRGGTRSGAGRPSIGVTKKVSITMPEEVWKAIDTYAHETGSQSATIREIIQLWFESIQLK